MFLMRYAELTDEEFWFTLDRHLSRKEFARKVRDQQAYVICDGEEPVGVFRYGLFWDSIPFCNLIYIREDRQGNGFGRKAMEAWEGEMCCLGYGMAMVSTQVDERAQHFYRRLGYKDIGGITMNIPGYEQPMELFMAKRL